MLLKLIASYKRLKKKHFSEEKIAYCKITYCNGVDLFKPNCFIIEIIQWICLCYPPSKLLTKADNKVSFFCNTILTSYCYLEYRVISLFPFGSKISLIKKKMAKSGTGLALVYLHLYFLTGQTTHIILRQPHTLPQDQSDPNYQGNMSLIIICFLSSPLWM